MTTHLVVLAAGKRTRMKAARPKVLHRVAGQPLIEHVLACAAPIHPQSTTVVVGHQAGELPAALGGHQHLRFVVQEPQLGTAHALMSTEAVLAKESGVLVLLSGDVPLLTPATLQRLVETHEKAGAAATSSPPWSTIRTATAGLSVPASGLHV